MMGYGKMLIKSKILPKYIYQRILMQVISMHVGGAGSKIGVQFWKQMQRQYKNKDTKTKNFYEEVKEGIYKPRALFADVDTRTATYVNKNDINFDQKSIIAQGSSCQNLFAEGMYNSGFDLVSDSIIDSARREVQRCDRLSGFIFSMSGCGGTGSGMGARLIGNLRQEYPADMFEVFPVLPGCWQEPKRLISSPLDIYNIVLMTHQLIENTELIMIMQNWAVEKILKHRGNFHPSFAEMNSFMGRCISEHTAPYRFSGPLNTNQRKRSTNLLPFPRLKTIRGALSQPRSKNCLVSALDWRQQLMTGVCRDDQRIFEMCATVRDPLCYEGDINQTILDQFKIVNNKFIQWLPHNIHPSILNDIHPEQGPSAWTLINGTKNIQGFKTIAELFTTQFRRKAFLHHYTSLGMDEMQFTQAESNMNDLVSEYTPCCGCYQDEEEFDEQWPE